MATLPLIVVAYGVSSNAVFEVTGVALVIGGVAWLVGTLSHYQRHRARISRGGCSDQAADRSSHVGPSGHGGIIRPP